jgi:ATP-dependent Lhr-like helicase
MDENMLIFLGGQSYVLFPWLGTRPFRTMRRFLKKYASELGISDIECERCYYITFKAKQGFKDIFEDKIREILIRDGLDTHSLVEDSECPVFDKFDEYIPSELLRDAYAIDRLRADEIFERFE